jgi:hypothetical protein
MRFAAVTCPGHAGFPTGNGTHEIRNWIVTAAAVAPARPVVLSNVAFAPGWNSGIHQLMWNAS